MVLSIPLRAFLHAACEGEAIWLLIIGEKGCIIPVVKVVITLDGIFIAMAGLVVVFIIVVIAHGVQRDGDRRRGGT